MTIDGRDAFISYASPTQLNFIVPDLNSVGTVSVIVTAESGAATSSTVVQRRAPAFFTSAWSGANYAIGTIGTSRTLAGPTGLVPGCGSRPVRRGEALVLYATGLGATTPTVPNGSVITPPYPTIQNLSAVTVYFDQVAVRPVYAGMTYAGLS